MSIVNITSSDVRFSDVPDGKQPMTFAAQRVFYANLPAEKKQPAIELLRQKISAEDQAAIRAAIVVSPRDWIGGAHHTFGMAIRNLLRQNGFGEDYWPIWNMDDIYIYLVEDAVKEVAT